MVYDSKLWGSGICPSSGIPETRNWMFPSLCDGRKTPTLLGLLQRANLNLNIVANLAEAILVKQVDH
jgi:hypothetical protein